MSNRATLDQIVQAFEHYFANLNKKGCSRNDSQWRREFIICLHYLASRNLSFLQAYFTTLSQMCPKDINFDCSRHDDLLKITVEGVGEQPPESVSVAWSRFVTWRIQLAEAEKPPLDPGKFSASNFTLTFSSKTEYPQP